MTLIPSRYHQRVGYLLAGLTSLVVEYALFLGLYYRLGLSAGWANAAAYTLGLITNFTLNRHTVFQASARGKTALRRQLLRYVALASFNLVLTSLIITGLVHWLPGFVAKLVVILLVVPWNYLAYKRLIFVTVQEPSD